MWDIRVVPFLVFGRDEARGGLRPTTVNFAHQAIPVDSARERLAELLIPEPFQLAGIDYRFALSAGPGVLVEPEEVSFGADSQFDELESSAG